MMTIQPTSAYTAMSFLSGTTQQRQSSTSDSAVATSSTGISADTATISQAARDLAAQENKITIFPDAPHAASYQQNLAEKFAGLNQIKVIMANDPSNPMWSKSLGEMADQGFSPGSGDGALYDISGTMPGASGNPKIDGVLRYSSGEPVTAESKTYQSQQLVNYERAVAKLYATEMAKGTPAYEILGKITDLQGQQPARFRAMMEWPNAADFTNGSNTATQGQTAKA